MIVCRSQSEIARLRRANQLVAAVLAKLKAMVAPGVTTLDIDVEAEAMVRAAGAVPAFKGYHGYPATVCASVNEQVVHGIPSKRPLVGGDIVSIDMGAVLDGFYGDCAVTVPVGDVSPGDAGAAAGDRGVAVPGHRRGEAGRAGLRHRRRRAAARRGGGFFGGAGVRGARHRHGAARGAADANYGPPGKGPRLAEGMVLAIEPMVNAGGPEVQVLADGWTAVARDGSLSAHFEHTVVVTREGCEILTLLADDSERARQLMGAAVRM